MARDPNDDSQDILLLTCACATCVQANTGAGSRFLRLAILRFITSALPAPASCDASRGGGQGQAHPSKGGDEVPSELDSVSEEIRSIRL